MADSPDFSKNVNGAAFSINQDDGKSLLEGGDALKSATGGIKYDWGQLNQLLDKASGLAAGYINKSATGEGVYQGQETALHQEDLGGGSNSLSPASLGQALIKVAKGGAAQNGQVASAQGAGQEQMAQKGLAEQQVVMQEKAAMMQSELQLQAQKAAITNSVAQVQQGINLAQTHLTNMFNNAVASATNASQYAQLQADQTAFMQIMDYVKSGLGGAATASAAGANYVKSNPNSAFSMAINPNNVWSSSDGYKSGQYAAPGVYNDPQTAGYGTGTPVTGTTPVPDVEIG